MASNNEQEGLNDVNVARQSILNPPTTSVRQVMATLQASPEFQVIASELQGMNLQMAAAEDAEESSMFGQTLTSESFTAEQSNAFFGVMDLAGTASDAGQSGLLFVKVNGVDENNRPHSRFVGEIVQGTPGQDPASVKVLATFDNSGGEIAMLSPGALSSTLWSRFRECVTKDCVGACLSSLVICSGTWAAYLACVAAACGGCALKCGACAGCDCSFWCKWASGCCR